MGNRFFSLGVREPFLTDRDVEMFPGDSVVVDGEPQSISYGDMVVIAFDADGPRLVGRVESLLQSAPRPEVDATYADLSDIQLGDMVLCRRIDDEHVRPLGLLNSVKSPLVQVPLLTQEKLKEMLDAGKLRARPFDWECEGEPRSTAPEPQQPV